MPIQPSMPAPASQEERRRSLVVQLATEQGVTMSDLCNASSNTRRAFANDLLNLTLASPSVNRHQQVDKDLAQWLPALNKCWYVNQVVLVKRKYNLSMDQAEAAVARRELPNAAARPWCSPTRARPRNRRGRRRRGATATAIRWGATTTTATAASRAPRRSGTGSRRCRAGIRRISICETGTALCVSEGGSLDQQGHSERTNR